MPSTGEPRPGPDECARAHPTWTLRSARSTPAVVVTLGRHPLQRYLPGARIGAVHGRMRRSYTGQHVFPMYHPAAALHQASLRETLVRDIRGLPAALLDARRALDDERSAAIQAEEAVRVPASGPETADDAEQMTLF